MKVHMNGISNIGKVRKNNEDSIYFDEALGLSIVCDGIGGREGGEIASQIATETMRTEVETWKTQSHDPTNFLKLAAQKTNSAIIAKSLEKIHLDGMGTTMECSLFHNGVLYLGHIGDSRTYLWHKNHFKQITVDHNVRTLAAKGEVPMEMANFANGDALVKALGVTKNAEIDVYEVKLEAGQVFVSASDGLFDMVSDEDIEEIVKANISNTAKMAQKLIDLACKNGGVDNVSVVISQIK